MNAPYLSLIFCNQAEKQAMAKQVLEAQKIRDKKKVGSPKVKDSTKVNTKNFYDKAEFYCYDIL